MRHKNLHPQRTTGISPRIRLATLVALGLSVLMASTAPAAPRDAIKNLELMSDLSARITAEGHLVFGPGAAGYLKVDVAPPGDARRVRNRSGGVFTSVAREGATRGQRGFSAQADDDRDGRTDEDRLDGLDNDGDGLIDEDFAAVGDAMVAFHLSDGPAGRPLHLEYYHWAHEHLKSAVFLSATGRPDLVDAGALRVATAGTTWREIHVPARKTSEPGHPARPEGSAWISRVVTTNHAGSATSCDPRINVWLGVRDLAPIGNSSRRESGPRLELELDAEATPLVFAAARSRQQLLRILDQAVDAYRGVTDPVMGRHTPWVAPPVCAACRRAATPAMSFRATKSGGVVLVAGRLDAHCGTPDPDLFFSGGQSLGSPDQVRWVPDQGPARTLAWSCLADEEPQRVWRRLTLPVERGHVEYVFGEVDAELLGETITGRYLDGRALRADLVALVEVPAIGIGLSGAHRAPDETDIEKEAESMSAEKAKILRAARHQPTLSPDLLEGWPNPFRDQIQLKFKVPRTMEEAFVWKDPEQKPANLDLQAGVPWSGGRPRTSVKIYSISGQELVTLQATDLGVGEYTVNWDGSDAFGRKVASGTYFCKLQLDDWSVTRRLVFLR